MFIIKFFNFIIILISNYYDSLKYKFVLVFKILISNLIRDFL